MLIQRGLLLSADGIDFEVIGGRVLALFRVSEPDFQTIILSGKRPSGYIKMPSIRPSKLG